MAAIEKASRSEGNAFVRIAGELRFIHMTTHDCIHRNVEDRTITAPTKYCDHGICHPSGCDYWQHWGSS